jgi:nicotinamidase/pyrazinamidase
MDKHVLSKEDTGVIVVDVQADFTELKSGSLAVPGTDSHYIEAVEKATRQLQARGLMIYLTQDWHPADHVSFYTNNSGVEPLQVVEIDGRPQVMWPPHCVQNTPGAEILVDLEKSAGTVRKGMNPKFDSYSGFADDGGHKTEMDSMLKRDRIRNLIIYGLATDYCVKATAIDAVEAGYRVTVIEGLSKGVAPETTADALQELEARGISVKAELEI